MSSKEELPKLNLEQQFKIEFKKLDDLITGMFYFLQQKRVVDTRMEILEDERNAMYLQYTREPILNKGAFLERYKKILEDSKVVALDEGFTNEEISDKNLRFYYLLFLREYKAENEGREITGH